MIIIDENVERHWIGLLRSRGYELLAIVEAMPGISDRQVLEVVQQRKGLLITEDKDFGELIFSYGIDGVAVILMRYDQPQYHLIEKQVLTCIENYFREPEPCFITVSKDKIRIRRI